MLADGAIARSSRTTNGFTIPIDCRGEKHTIFVHDNYSIFSPHHNFTAEDFVYRNFGGELIPCLELFHILTSRWGISTESLDLMTNDLILHFRRKRIEVFHRNERDYFNVRSILNDNQSPTERYISRLARYSLSRVYPNLSKFILITFSDNVASHIVSNELLVISPKWLDLYKSGQDVYNEHFVVERISRKLSLLDVDEVGNFYIRIHYI